MGYKTGRIPCRTAARFGGHVLSDGLRIREQRTDFLRGTGEGCMLASCEEDVARCRIQEETPDFEKHRAMSGNSDVRNSPRDNEGAPLPAWVQFYSSIHAR
jgi:hypothetical protein